MTTDASTLEPDHFALAEPRWSSVIRGVAYGDSWGDPNEFRSYPALVNADHPFGPDMPEHLRVTDDTQMTLYLADALGGPSAVGAGEHTLRGRILDAWAAWVLDPDNNRAPGGTCLIACHRLARGMPWERSTVPTSTGCGTVMRTSSTAFLSDDLWLPVTGFAAASTHGAPSAVVSALVMAHVMRQAVVGNVGQGDLLTMAISLTKDHDWMRKGLAWIDCYPLMGRHGADNYLARGTRDLMGSLSGAASVAHRFRREPWGADPCTWAGRGWNAHTCLAAALLCASMLPDDPVAALRRATATGGDSDSIAAVAGALIGACHDVPWPTEWITRLEPRYRAWVIEADGYEFA